MGLCVIYESLRKVVKSDWLRERDLNPRPSDIIAVNCGNGYGDYDYTYEGSGVEA